MGMLSCLLARRGGTGRLRALVRGMRLTLAGLRIRLSRGGSRRSRYKKHGKRMNATRNFSRLTGYSGLLAGAAGRNGSNSGSRARNANNYRWNTNSNIAGQFAADTGVSNTPGWTGQPCRDYPGKTHNGGAGGSVTTRERHPVQIIQ